MSRRFLCLSALWLAGLTASSTLGRAADPPPAAASETYKVDRGPFRAVHESDAVLVPAEFVELAVHPEAYEGELRVVEAVPHGAQVRRGDVILRLDDEKARDLLRTAEWARRTAERTLVDTRARREEFEADSERDIARAEMDLDLAEKSLKGFNEVSRPLDKEEYEAGERSHKYRIEDEEDELAQLGKMYKEDQLTEETEEIVLKRAKRRIDELKKQLTFYVQRHGFAEAFMVPVQSATLENAVKDKRKALREVRRARESAKILGQVEIEKLEAELESADRRAKRLHADLDQLSLKAPYDGVALHCSLTEKVAINPLRPHATVQPHQTLITIATAGPLKARFSIPAKDRYRLTAGMSSFVLPDAMPDARLAGSLAPVKGFPLADGAWEGYVVFGHDDERLLPLFKAHVVITLCDSPDVLTLPLSAVFRKGDRTICYVQAKSPFGILPRTIVTGPDDGKRVVVREGLNEGEEVLLKEPAP